MKEENCKSFNLIGQKYNRLTIIDVVNLNNRWKVKCLCECGAIKILERSSVVNGQQKSCGCLKKKYNYQEYIGFTSGKLTIVSIDDNLTAHCVCECGGTHSAWFYGIINSHNTKCASCSKTRENNPNWKGGITSDNARVRYSTEYKTWREDVYKRDNFTCQACLDNSGGNLHAHHILSFSEHIDKRFDLDNGITLCSKCHNFNQKDSFHYNYGSKNNSYEQLEEYIKYKRGIKNGT